MVYRVLSFLASDNLHPFILVYLRTALVVPRFCGFHVTRLGVRTHSAVVSAQETVRPTIVAVGRLGVAFTVGEADVFFVVLRAGCREACVVFQRCDKFRLGGFQLRGQYCNRRSELCDSSAVRLAVARLAMASMVRCSNCGLSWMTALAVPYLWPAVFTCSWCHSV